MKGWTDSGHTAPVGAEGDAPIDPSCAASTHSTLAAVAEMWHLSVDSSVGIPTSPVSGNSPHPTDGDHAPEGTKDQTMSPETSPLIASAIRTVFESAPDGILIVDSDGVIREANPQALRILGYDRDDLVGTVVERIVPEQDRRPHRRQREAYVSSPHQRPMGPGLDLRALRADGREIPVKISLTPCVTASGEFVIAAIRDDSVQRQLRRLGSGQLQAAEEERQRIARELHDDTAQCLAALRIRLQLLRRVRTDEDRARLLDEMQEELGTAMEGVRRISRGLRPPALDDAGLETALRSHFRAVVEPSTLRGRMRVEPVGAALGSEAQLVVYRVVQEALANVVRHAGASSVELVLTDDGERLVACVADDGSGFDPASQLLSGSGLGLIGMRERARLIGAEISIESSPEDGTRVTLTVPRAKGPGAAPHSPTRPRHV